MQGGPHSPDRTHTHAFFAKQRPSHTQVTSRSYLCFPEELAKKPADHVLCYTGSTGKPEIRKGEKKRERDVVDQVD